MKFILCAIIFLLSSSAFAESAVILIDFGDRDGFFKDINPANIKRAAEVYKELGYDRVIVVQNEKDVRAAIERSFQSLGPVNRLAIETVGHGFTEPASTEFPQRYPLLPPVPSLGAYPEDKPETFRFGNGYFGHNISFPPDLKAEADRDIQSAILKTNFRQDVGPGDFAGWIQEFRKQNPNAPVTFNMGQCYSGHAARVFNSLPGVQAFASSSDREMAHADKDTKRGQIDFWLDELTKAAKEQPTPSHLEVFHRTREKWMPLAMQHGRLTEVPWSPVDAYINNWCAANPTKVQHREDAQKERNPMLQAMKKVTDLTLKYEKDIVDLKTELLRCEGTNRPAQIDKMLRESAQQQINSINRLLADFDRGKWTAVNSRVYPGVTKESVRAEFERVKTCLTANPKADCGDRKSQVASALHHVFPSTEPESDSGGGDACSESDFESIKRCFELGAKIKNPGSLYSHVDWNRGYILHYIKTCDAKADDKRLKGIAGCYNSFWQLASGEDLSGLEKLGRLMHEPVRGNSRPGDANSPRSVK